jgi:LTXXQ motif family protein
MRRTHKLKAGSYSRRERSAPTNGRSLSFLLSQCTLRLNCDTIELWGEDMRYFSVLLIGAGLKTARPTKARLMRGIATAAILLLTIPPITDAAGAGPGGKGGGFGGHVGVSARGFAGRGGLGFAGGPVGGARIGGRGIGDRSLGVSHFSGRSILAPRAGVATARFSANHFGGTRVAGPGRGVFGNRAITNAALQSRLGFARFHGRFFGSPSPWWWSGLAIGWIGPVFWPYAYFDFFDYVFWPYAYDDFWPYAYDDVYYGIYGPYAHGGPAVGTAAAPDVGIRARGANTTEGRVASAGGSEQRAAEVCSNGASDLTDWPIARISEVVQPTEAQRPALDELRAASQKAMDILKAGCPSDLPSTPTGRLAAMETRVKVMLEAVQTVRPPLERFYQLLSDEQKARLNAVSPGGKAIAEEDQRALTKFCRERVPAVTDLPFDRIAQATQPTPAQRSALDELKDVSSNAAERLRANCPSYAAVTPTGRIEAMEKRLEATHGAALVVQPALTKFYNGLSDEQKARFNSLRADARTYPTPAAVIVDQEHSRPHERGKTISSSTSVAPPQQVDEE